MVSFLLSDARSGSSTRGRISDRKMKAFLVAMACVLSLAPRLFGGEQYAASHLSGIETASPNFSIAACTTWHPVLRALQEQGAVVRFTSRTRESLAILQNGQVDMVIGGRLPVPGEPNFPYEVMGPGFIFLARQPLVLAAGELHRFQFVTDQEPSEIHRVFDGIGNENLTLVENVYDHLASRIVITAVDTVDYARARPVLIRDALGAHHRYSRVPIVFYRPGITESDLAFVRAAFGQLASSKERDLLARGF